MIAERKATLVLASRNIRKIAELKKLLFDKFPQITFLSLLDFPKLELPPLQAQTLKARSAQKAEVVAKVTGLVTLSDEWVLIIPSLGGELESIRKKDLPRKNMLPDTNALLLELQGKEGLDRTAYCECSQTLASPVKGILKSVSARMEGTIAEVERGQSSTEFASVFMKYDYGKTIGELPPSIQAVLSTRKKALDALQTTLNAALT